MSLFLDYWKRLINSFKVAFRGIWFVVRTQRNFHIHLIAAITVVIFGFWLKINSQEWLAVIITIFVVISAEAFNTAIEKLVDMVSPEYNKLAGLVKDIAAGAVLLTAIMAVIVGCVIFLPKLIALF